MPKVDFSDVEQDFWFHVSPQEALPLAGSVEVNLDLTAAAKFFEKVATSTGDKAREVVALLLLKDPSMFGDIRQFLGISDKRAYLDLSYTASRIEHPKQDCSLCGCNPWTLTRHPLPFFVGLLRGTKGKEVQEAAAFMMADYLLKHGLYQSAPGFSSMSSAVLELLYARLISPKEYQMRAAKRRGHGCEASLAAVLDAANLTIIPRDKASNPMGARDPNLDLSTMKVVDRVAGSTHSFDMVLTSDRGVTVAVQSLIHTSDPGQYGVNKSDETVDILSGVRRWNSRNVEQPVELWALLDGVGFSENKIGTINKILKNVDYFIQIKTLYRALLRAHGLGLTRIDAISFSEEYEKYQIDQIVDLHVPKGVDVYSSDEAEKSELTAIPAGMATLFIKEGKGLPKSQDPLQISTVA